ncbi:hypothetical protein [Kitasatospora sp. NPDC096204]|uniref:hypothetical protein n=1 Tax=Kitasatospora sp. NPDC096204 TaxID=3364094 RepID=UPI0037F7BB57
MSEPAASTLVEVVPAPQNPPSPDPKPSKSAPQPAPQGAMPGVPLAVAVANALGTAGAGAATLGGAATVAVVGAAAGAAALGGLARRVRNRRRTTDHQGTAGAAAFHHAAARGGSFSPPARTTGFNSASSHGRSGGSAGAASRPGSGPVGRRAAAGAPVAADRKGPVMPRTAGTTTPAAHHIGAVGGVSRPSKRSGRNSHDGPGGYRPPAIVHTLAKAASRLPGLQDPAPAGRTAQRPARRDERLARVAERTARRVAKGQAKALRAAGIDPATGSGANPKNPAGSSGAGRVNPVQATALRRSAMRHRARMGAAALATGLVGLGSALAGNWKHKGKVAGHMRRTWQRLATRARAVRQTRDGAILGKQAADGTQVPVPAETVNVPGRKSRAMAEALASAFPRRQEPGEGPETRPITLGTPTKEKHAMSESLDGTAATFSLASAADVILQAATTFDPETMADFKALIEELPTAFTTLQDVLRVLAEKAAEQLPVDPSVVEEIGSGYRAMGRVVNALEEVSPTFRKAHAEDLERQENPRNGLEAERKWNV